MCHGVVYTGSFVLDYHALYLRPRLQNIEIPYRACPERVGPRILSLESVDYFGTSDHFSGRKKKRIIVKCKTSRFTGKSGSRIGDGESGIEDHFKKKKIQKQIVDRGDVGHRLYIYFTEHNPVRCTEHLI